MFSAHKSLYFVFKNEGERYFQDSMLQLDLYDYLWLELRKSGYENIYFIDGTSDKAVFCILDGDSYDEYHKGFKFRFGKPEAYQAPIQIELEKAKAAQRILRLAGNTNGKTAFVIQNHVFTELFSPSGHQADLEKLIRQQQNSRNPVILLGSMEMNVEELERYVSPKGVFGYKTEKGQCLCRELHEIVWQKDIAPVFDGLKEKIPEQFLEIGAIEFAGLAVLMRNVQFSRGEIWEKSDFDSYVNFLYWWIYKDKLKSFCGGLFSSIPGKLTYQALYQKLITEEGMRSFLARVNGQRQVYEERYAGTHEGNAGKIPMNQILAEEYGVLPQQFTKQESHILLAAGELSALSDMQWPGAGCEEWKNAGGFQIGQVREEDWDSMRKNLRKPRNAKLFRSRLKNIDSFRQCMQRAVRQRDAGTMQRAENVLMFCGSNLYMDTGYEKYCEDAQSYLKISESYFAMTQQMEALQQLKGIAQEVLQAKLLPLQVSVKKMQNVLQKADVNFIYVRARKAENLGQEIRQMLNGCQGAAMEETGQEGAVDEDYSMLGGDALLEKYAGMH